MIKQFTNTFFRFQTASLIASAVDFGMTIFLKEAAGVWYLAAASAGSVIGGIVNFFLGRRWVFDASDFPTGLQALRYFISWGGSILLNISGVFILTTGAGLNYIYSKVAISFFVGIFFNFVIQKKFVFK